MSLWNRMLASRRWLFLPPLVVGVIVIALLARSRKELQRAEVQEAALPIEVIRAQATGLRAEIVGFGTARPQRIWSAVAEVGGRVVDLRPNLRPGVAVSEGEVLVRIDDSDYRLRVQQRTAELRQAESQLEQLEVAWQADRESHGIQQALLAVRADDVERFRQLRGSSVASQVEADASQAAYLQQSQVVQDLSKALATYPAQILSAKAAIQLAQSRLKEAERDVERTEIRAPFTGLLSRATLELDQFLAPNERLFEVHDTEFVEVEAQFSLAQIERLFGSRPIVSADDLVSNQPVSGPEGQPSGSRPIGNPPGGGLPGNGHPGNGIPGNGQDVILGMDLLANLTTRSGNVSLSFSGNVIRVTESLDEQTRTLGVVVRVHNETSEQSQLLRVGAYCEVRLSAQAPAPALVVPRTSVESDQVWLIDEQNRLRRRKIQIAFTQGTLVAVEEGLSVGDLVVIDPPAVAMDGMLTRPIEIEGEATASGRGAQQ